MGLWASEIQVPDTSVPKLKNANTLPREDWFGWIFNLFATGRVGASAITPEEGLGLVSWRPPRQDEIDLSYGPSKKVLQELVLKESWIKAMMLRLVRDQLNACYKDNGVNHYDNCAHLSELYLKWMREGYRVRGGKLRMKIDQKQLMRREFAARPPPEAPVSRPYYDIYNEKRYEKKENGNGDGK